jgi:hypothetical protein
VVSPEDMIELLNTSVAIIYWRVRMMYFLSLGLPREFAKQRGTNRREWGMSVFAVIIEGFTLDVLYRKLCSTEIVTINLSFVITTHNSQRYYIESLWNDCGLSMQVDTTFITNQRHKKYQVSVPMHSDRKKKHTQEEEKSLQWLSYKLL